MNLSEYKSFQSEFLDLIRETERIAGAVSLSALAEPCCKLHDRILEERFYVSVLGEIKRGKSTLINALLGADVLPKSSMICTAALCIIKHGPAPRTTIFHRDGKKSTPEVAQLAQMVTRKNKSVSEIAHVEIEYPLPLLKNGIIIVDTPGVNDTDELRRRLTEEFIPRSDGVIFVLNAGQPLSSSEMNFLSNEVLKYNLKKIWFVINGIDRLASDSDREEAIDFCRTHINEVLPGARIFPVSAKLALEASLEGDLGKQAASKLPEFFDQFSRDLISERHQGLFEVPLGIIESLHNDIERGIAWSDNLLKTDRTKFKEQEIRIKEEASRTRTEIDRVLNRFYSGVEAIVYETASSMRNYQSTDLTHPVRRILKSEEPDEQKVSQLAALASGHLQCFASIFLDNLHKKVSETVLTTQKEIGKLLAGLDSRFFSGDDQKVPTRPPLESLPIKPGLGVEGRSLVSSFGRLSTMVFLLQGNLLLAAASLAASFVARLKEGDTGRVTETLGEQLAQSRQKMLDHFIKERDSISRHYQNAMGESVNRAMAVSDEVMEKAREFIQISGNEMELRENRLKEASAQLRNLRESRLGLSKRVATT